MVGAPSDVLTVVDAPLAFHLLAKPTGAICNLDCEYCFFLSKEMLYPGSRFRMADDLLEAYIRQLLEAHRTPEVVVAWQGGEPTMMGLDFFRRSIALQERYAQPGQTVVNTIQTNGTLLDDAWCEFFAEHGFLVGISVDGPRAMHDAYRVDKGGKPTFDRVMRGLRLVRKHGVEHNALTTVHRANGDHGREVYRFLRDDAGFTFIQFIPIVERAGVGGVPYGDTVTDRSVTADQFGWFLVDVFEEWVRHDVGEVFVQMFDVALANWFGEPPSLCVFAETCGTALAIEHNGDVYSCDHFVEPNYLLGNIGDRHLLELVASPRQRQFGRDKRDTLPAYCRSCDVRFACHGGCPKDRFIATPAGEPGLNYLCAGYQTFFRHVDKPMREMAGLLRRGRAPAEIMQTYSERDRARAATWERAPRNAPCPCGSGRKQKHCHGGPGVAVGTDGRSPG
jgi:uncharacterized protein